MRIILMTLSTPTYNNVRAASALPYHLIMGAKELGDIDFEVYSYNINEIDAAGIAETERSLNVRLHLLQKPWWVTWMFRLHLGILRVLLKYPYLSYLRVPEETIKKIKSSNPDIIWIYGEEIAGIAKTFEGIKRIVTMPDCESMFYYRMLRQRWATKHLSQILRYAFAYWQYRSMERRNCHANVIYHFVGETDAEFFKNINPSSKAIFLRHPLYAFNELKKIAFSEPKIKLLFAGRYDFYCEHGSNELLDAMLGRKQDLINNFEITFLGKGWETWNERLKTAGFVSSHIKFAPNYITELQKHDIQINAIDVGTGTKGKVLDAISNGLLAFGTNYALENVAVRNGESCVQYSTVEEAMDRLMDICAHRNQYEQMAENGRKIVLLEHDRGKIADTLFDITKAK
ncbi:glycosyltransferase family 1 protein [Hallella colorans]|uniref:glycosyltransferase family 1 protein n=1 Tax=Hallella colorans TaxID=1703337 RepID=UPI0023F4B8C8|nr:glycosyltransferase family 1 protein [Hallella colorans]